MTATIHPHGRTEIPESRVEATASYLLDRGLRPHEVIDALVAQLEVSVADAFAATDSARRGRGEAYFAPRA